MRFYYLLGVGAIGAALFFYFSQTSAYAETVQSAPSSVNAPAPSSVNAPVPSGSNIPEKLRRWEDQVKRASYLNNIPTALIYAVMMRESGGDKSAFRDEGEFMSRGLMQISGPAARDMGYSGKLDSLMDPRINVYYGAKYLRWLFNQFHADPTAIDSKWDKAVSAYNAGLGNVRDHGIINPDYVSYVKRHFKQYRR